MTTKNCVNVPKLVLKDLCEKSFVQNVLYSMFSMPGESDLVESFVFEPRTNSDTITSVFI